MGFETPFRAVELACITRPAPVYMTADEEDDLRVAPGDSHR